MKLLSIKQRQQSTFSDALFEPISSDGSLFFPNSFPEIDLERLKNLKFEDHSNGTSKATKEVAEIVLSQWLKDEFSKDEIANIVQKALTFDYPLKKVGDFWVLELFHGPTLAFKDTGARFLAQLMSAKIKKNQSKVIFVATSGDTGGAVASAFSGLENIKVVLLFPKGKVSPLQREQLTKVSKNVISLEIEGVFDQCQSYVKQLSVDPKISKYSPTTANSINIGRLIAQTIYYFTTVAKLKTDQLEFVVPSGNFGNVTAGLLAKQCGLKNLHFIASNNQNATFSNYLKTGKYQVSPTIATISNAMDISDPSNVSRIFSMYQTSTKNGINHLKEDISATSISDQETIQTIKDVYQKYDYLLDPHTAVAWSAGSKFSGNSRQKVIVSTASPLKFAEVINQKTGIKVDDQSLFSGYADKIDSSTQLPADYQTIRSLIIEKLES